MKIAPQFPFPKPPPLPPFPPLPKIFEDDYGCGAFVPGCQLGSVHEPGGGDQPEPGSICRAKNFAQTPLWFPPRLPSRRKRPSGCRCECPSRSSSRRESPPRRDSSRIRAVEAGVRPLVTVAGLGPEPDIASQGGGCPIPFGSNEVFHNFVAVLLAGWIATTLDA